jgi:heat-inducible transcriptional repressor
MEKLERQRALLQAIVQEYIKTAKPVSSQALAEDYGFDFSPATIRNDMAALEEAGYIRQPHTSAGRTPTEKGYQYYIQHFLQPRQLRANQKAALTEVVRQPVAKNDANREQQWIQQLAKTLATLTGEAVIVSADGNQLFYTGMSHMFR